MILIPPYLKPGDTIGIAATARWLTPEQLEQAKVYFKQMELEVVVAENVLQRDFQLAGSAVERIAGLNRMLHDERIKAVVIARGGYGSVHCVDGIDWDQLIRRPKWILGYSDVTLLLTEAFNRGLASIHSTMPISFPEATERAVAQIREALFGQLTSVEWESNEELNLDVTGDLIGGNLSVLYSILGSSSFPKTDGAILFVEDVDEMVYHIDRMMMGLKRAGALNGLKAIVVGGLTQMKDNTKEHGFSMDNPFGGTALSHIESVALNCGVPMLSGFPAGHMSDNRAFYHGRRVRLQSESGQSKVTWL
jgi:muramoyltetrapeptide carboxypeptidase